jgi:hypothetical protein
MTAALEPELSAELQALMSDHSALLYGFALGRELASRVNAIRELDQPLPPLRDRALAIFKPMEAQAKLLASRAQLLIKSLVEALRQPDHLAFSLVSAAYETGKNGLIAFGRAVHPFAEIGAATAVASAALGHPPDGEVLLAAVAYLRANGPEIVAFAEIDPQLRSWLGWLLSEMAKLRIGEEGNRPE